MEHSGIVVRLVVTLINKVVRKRKRKSVWVKRKEFADGGSIARVEPHEANETTRSDWMGRIK